MNGLSSVPPEIIRKPKVNALVSWLFELALIRIYGLFEAIFIPLGFSGTRTCKYPPLIRNFVYLKWFFVPLGRKTFQLFEVFKEINRNIHFINLKKKTVSTIIIYKSICVKFSLFQNINSGIQFYCKENNKKHEHFWKTIVFIILQFPVFFFYLFFFT